MSKAQVQINAILVFENAFNSLEKEFNRAVKSSKTRQNIDKSLMEKLPPEVNYEDIKQQIYDQIPEIIPQEKETMGQVIPGVVLLSFSIELALKVLIKQLTGKDVKGHRLDELLNKLPQDKKSHIRDQVKIELNKNDEEFNMLVDRNNNGFVDWRYFYEKSGNFDLQFMKILLREIKSHIHWGVNTQDNTIVNYPVK